MQSIYFPKYFKYSICISNDIWSLCHRTEEESTPSKKNKKRNRITSDDDSTGLGYLSAKDPWSWQYFCDFNLRQVDLLFFLSTAVGGLIPPLDSDSDEIGGVLKVNEVGLIFDSQLNIKIFTEWIFKIMLCLFFYPSHCWFPTPSSPLNLWSTGTTSCISEFLIVNW